MLQSISQEFTRHDTAPLLLLVAVLGVTFGIYCIFYRLFWHPLAGYPGPLIAGVTPLYKAYVELLGKGCLVHKLEELHSVYGDIIRISPNELHFAAPSVYFEIYNFGRRWDKDELFYRAFLRNNSTFGFTKYKQANERKSAMNWLFSKKGIRNVHPLIESRVKDLCKSFERYNGSVIDLYYAFRWMSLDVITDLCFGIPIDKISSSETKSSLVTAMDIAQLALVGLKHSSIYRAIFSYTPLPIAKLFEPRMAGFLELEEFIRERVHQARQDIQISHEPEHSTLIHKFLQPDFDKSTLTPESIVEECQVLLLAGTDTTGTTLMRGCFHILNSKIIYATLKDELEHAWPQSGQSFSLSDLERLPYLTAVIKESLRMNQGVVSPLSRVVPPSGAVIGGRYVPGDTVVGMSTHFVLQNDSIFERPSEFRPQRWLGDGAKDLDKWLVSFSKGPRSCLGINLAWAELYTCFAHVFRKFDINIEPSRQPRVGRPIHAILSRTALESNHEGSLVLLLATLRKYGWAVDVFKWGYTTIGQSLGTP